MPFPSVTHLDFLVLELSIMVLRCHYMIGLVLWVDGITMETGIVNEGAYHKIGILTNEGPSVQVAQDNAPGLSVMVY